MVDVGECFAPLRVEGVLRGGQLLTQPHRVALCRLQLLQDLHRRPRRHPTASARSASVVPPSRVRREQLAQPLHLCRRRRRRTAQRGDGAERHANIEGQLLRSMHTASEAA